MDANMITTMIGSLGFPIVSCVALFWYITKTNEQHKEEIKGAFPLTIALIKIKYLDKFKQGGRALKQGKL